MATPFLFLKPLLGLGFNSQKCCHTFVNWYYNTALYASVIAKYKTRIGEAAKPPHQFWFYIWCFFKHYSLPSQEIALRREAPQRYFFGGKALILWAWLKTALLKANKFCCICS